MTTTEERNEAWKRAFEFNSPCDVCGQRIEPHHATVFGQNLCHQCYQMSGRPLTQAYPGDEGGAPFLEFQNVASGTFLKKEKSVASLLDDMKLVCHVCRKALPEHGHPFPCTVKSVPVPGTGSGEIVCKLGKPVMEYDATVAKPLEIVGHCPQCGAPIYGQKKLMPFEQPPIFYGCTCWRKSGLITQTMETK